MKKSVAVIVCLVLVAMVPAAAPAWSLTAEEEAVLTASDGYEGDGFGFTVALNGDTAVVGTPGSTGDPGSAYVFTRSGGAWTEQAKLLASDGAGGDWFARCAAVDADSIVLGAHGDDDNGEDSGSAYVFARMGDVWTEQAKLLPADGEANDRFGVGVAIDGETAIIGADYDDDNGSVSGSAYVFVRNGGVWVEQAKLLPSDGAADDYFGRSVAVEGDTALIGSWHSADNGVRSGAAYIFTRSAGVWTQQTKLLPFDHSGEIRFGWSVALGGDRAIIGAPEHVGSAYIFERTANQWWSYPRLLPLDPLPLLHFGNSVALDGDIAVIGSTYRDTGYVFQLTGGAWGEKTKLAPETPPMCLGFAEYVALSGTTAMTGAYSQGQSPVACQGTAYVFRLYDSDVPAVGSAGIAVLLLAVLGTGVYFLRRRVY